MTTINADEWTTASEAARLLGVSSQRIIRMADEDGSLDVIRPWPHVTLVGRRSLAAWLAGARQERIGPANARRWLLKQCQAAQVQEIDIDVARDRLRDFIEQARPRWTPVRKDLWALEMAGTLWSTGAAA